MLHLLLRLTVLHEKRGLLSLDFVLGHRTNSSIDIITYKALILLI
jgi:hypothetical protein